MNLQDTYFPNNVFNYIYNHIYHYLIDTKIKFSEHDTLLIKSKKILLRYKRIIAIILLIILLIIGYQCKLYYLYVKHTDKTCILNGGGMDAMSAMGDSGGGDSGGKSKMGAALGNAKNFGNRQAENAKELAPWFYGIIYSVALTILAFLILMPAIGFFILGIICFALLKDNIGYIKSL